MKNSCKILQKIKESIDSNTDYKKFVKNKEHFIKREKRIYNE